MRAGEAIGHIYNLAWFATRESMPHAIYEQQQDVADKIASDICNAIGVDEGELRAAWADEQARNHTLSQPL